MHAATVEVDLGERLCAAGLGVALGVDQHNFKRRIGGANLEKLGIDESHREHGGMQADRDGKRGDQKIAMGERAGKCRQGETHNGRRLYRSAGIKVGRRRAERR
ncbi:MAG: hypothetical protein RR758_04505 [Burkholderiaceae bacterium]